MCSKNLGRIVLLVLVLSGVGQARGQAAGLRPVKENGKWGYADRSGHMVITPRFDEAGEFADGLAKVGVVDVKLPAVVGKPNVRWGYIDESGRDVVALRYYVLRDFAEGLAAAAVLDAGEVEAMVPGRGRRANLRWGYVDRQGREVIAPRFFEAGDFSEGLAAVDVGGVDGSACGRPHKFGYVDLTGVLRIEPRFAVAVSFRGGRARVGVGEQTYVGRCLCCAPKFLGIYGYVNREGEFTPDAPADGADPRDNP
ncbi:MAG TPA: WG repeat-containing protein [Pyrinomonadaceae bacterium]|jgi:hypothetical protein|nr:WG repeat-containing protein [Pyrinomonadaceae bacterium]